MTNKALVVAVWDYGRYAEELTAPKYELQQWKDLLSQTYDFEVTPLENEQATRQAVLDGLRTLLKGATKDDRLLFVFEGHGDIVPGPDGGKPEQAIIASPLQSGLEDAAIRESDVHAIFKECQPPLGTRITFVIGCCHSADFGAVRQLRINAGVESIFATAIPLAAPPVMQLDREQPIRRFGDFAEREASYERPVILAATGKDDVAYEVTIDGVRRMLFTARLISSLKQVRDTFRNIRDRINPLHPVLQQMARLGGNESRWDELFPGGAKPGENRELQQSRAEDKSVVNLRVMGIASFVNRRSATAPYRARIILPYDEGKYVSGDDVHFACIEFATEEMAAPPTGPLASLPAKTYVRAGVEYKRWNLTGYLVTIQTGDLDEEFTRTQEFHDHVPKLINVEPDLAPFPPDPSCFTEAPGLNRFAAFVNLPGGVADIGPLQTLATRYVRLISNTPTYGPIVTPRSVKVTVPVISKEPTIVLHPSLDPKREYLVVTLRPGATVLIANARETDITGTGEGDIPREQFRLYYKLAINEPTDPPVPIVSGIPTDDCTVTDYP